MPPIGKVICSVWSAFKYTTWAHHNLVRSKEWYHYLHFINLIIRKQLREKWRPQKSGRFKTGNQISCFRIQWSFFCIRGIPKCNTANQLPCSNMNFHRHVFPLRLDRSVWPQSPCLNHSSFFVETKKKLLENQNWTKYKWNFWWKKSNENCNSDWLCYLKYANVFSFMQKCVFHYVIRLWFFFQMPCFNSTILQYFAECSTGQKYI